MKRLFLILILLFFASPVSAGDMQLTWTNPYVAGSAVGTTSCNYSVDSNTSGTDELLVCYFTSKACVSTQFTASSNYTIKSITVSLKRNGTPSSDGFTSITGKICTDSSDKPSTTCSSEGTLDTSGLGTTYADKIINLATGYALTESNKYHIVLCPNSCAASNETNFVRWQYNEAGSGYMNTSTLPCCSWSNENSSAQARFTTSDCTQ